MDIAKPPFFIGIDGGGSKTAAVVTDSSLRVLGEGRAGPSNHLRVGIDAARLSVENAMFDAVRAAGIQPDSVAWTYCGIAGSEHPQHRRTVVQSLEHLFPKGNFTVDSDGRVALTAGIGFGAGIALIAGTGSVAFGRNPAGKELRAGGWGPTIGDEGSGYWIAVQGLSAIARAIDGRGPRTKMTDLLCSHYGMCEPDDLPYFVYAPTTHADDIARYCRLVIEAANAGDEIARTIFRNAGGELAKLVIALATRLGVTQDTIQVACSGGAFASGELIFEPLTEQVREAMPNTTTLPANERPVIGAARMAIRAAEDPRPDRG